MRDSLRLSFATLALVALGACSRSAEQPAMTDELKQDLASVGGGDVQLAGAMAPRLDVVSAAERGKSAVPAPTAKTVSRAPSAFRGNRAIVRSVRHESPAAAAPAARAAEVAPAETRVEEPMPEPAPASQARPRAPQPSTQREPPGGWRTPGSIIRNAPFPINP